MLEVGCNYGFLLEELKKNNINCEGLEMDIDTFQHCKEKRFDVTNSSVEDFSNTNKYDLIFAGMVMNMYLIQAPLSRNATKCSQMMVFCF